MSAIMMMLKSMGINPDEMLKQVEDAKAEAQKIVASFEARLDRIEAKLDSLTTEKENDDG